MCKVAEAPAHGVGNCSSQFSSTALAEALLRRALGPVPMLIAALPRASSGNLAKASASSLGLTSG